MFKYLLCFLLGVILFLIVNYILYENFTIGGPVIRILQDNNTYNYSFIFDNIPIPDNKTLVDDKVYDLSVTQLMLLNGTGIFGEDIINYDGPDPRTIYDINNPFYNGSIINLESGCPILPTTDPSILPDGYKVIMIPITKTKDFEILFGLYDPLLAIDYKTFIVQSVCAPMISGGETIQWGQDSVLEQLHENCLNLDYINMSNKTFNETHVITGFLRVYDLCRTYELLERDTHETQNYMHLKNLQNALETMNRFILEYSEKKDFIDRNVYNYDRILTSLEPLYNRSSSYERNYYTYYNKYRNNNSHLTLLNRSIDDSDTSDDAWELYTENLFDDQHRLLEEMSEKLFEERGWITYENRQVIENREAIDDYIRTRELTLLKLNRRDFNTLFQYRKNQEFIETELQKYQTYNVYLDKYYKVTKIADFTGNTDVQRLPDGNSFIVYLSAIVKNDLPVMTSCEDIIRYGFDNFRISIQAFVMSLVGTSQNSTDLIQMGYCTSDLYRTGFKRLVGLQERRMPQTALKLHLNVVKNLETSGIILNNLLVSPLPSMMRVLRDHLCIAYNIPMGIVSLGFQDDENNPNFTLMDKDLMELDLDHRRALYEIVEILFSNPLYLNRGEDGRRLYIDYSPELPLYTPTKFELERLRYVYNILKSQKDGVISLANANQNFDRLIKILFNIQPDSRITLLKLPIELTKPEKDLLKKHKSTDIEGLITHSLLEVANYDYMNENIVSRDGVTHPILTMFYQYVEQSVICLDIQKVSDRLLDIQSSQQPTIFEYTRSSLVKCKNPLEINCRELSLGTEFAYFRNISHAAGKIDEGDPVTTDNSSNMIHKSYINGNLIILERQIIYNFDIVYITDSTIINEFTLSIGDWVKIEESGYNPIGNNMIINCTTSELIEMLKLQWYESLYQLTQSTSTFGYKRDDPLIIDKITSNMILKGIHPVTEETIYIHILRPDNIWKPNDPDDPDDPDEIHYRYMLHYGSCDPSQTTTPCQITDQMYVRYYNPTEAKLIGIKKGDGLLNIAYENGGMIRRPIQTDESQNFSEFVFDMDTEIKFNDDYSNFDQVLSTLDFESNTEVVLNPPFNFGLIQRKAHVVGFSTGGFYHDRNYSIQNRNTPDSKLVYFNPDKNINTEILLSSIVTDSIRITENRDCWASSNEGNYIMFSYTDDDGNIKNEKLFIKLEYVEDQNSSQYRFLELMRSLQQ